jgi:hypothetical protein
MESLAGQAWIGGMASLDLEGGNMISRRERSLAKRDQSNQSKVQPKPGAPEQLLGQPDPVRLDLKASLRVISWLNETLDAAAKAAGKQINRDAALALLILHKNGDIDKGKKFLQIYRSWRVSPKSVAAEETLRVALGQLMLEGLVTVGRVNVTATGALKNSDVQMLIGDLLCSGLNSLRKLRLTPKAVEKVKAMRQTIDSRLDATRKSLTPGDRKLFDKVVQQSLPDPPAKLPKPRAVNH